MSRFPRSRGGGPKEEALAPVFSEDFPSLTLQLRSKAQLVIKHHSKETGGLGNFVRKTALDAHLSCCRTATGHFLALPHLRLPAFGRLPVFALGVNEIDCRPQS